jgi:hypothetical protein
MAGDIVYKGILYPDSFIKGNFIMEFDSVPNTGICRNSTFEESGDKFSLSLLLIERKDWQRIAIVKDKDTKVFNECESNESTATGTLNEFDFIKIQAHHGECFRIELEEKAYGYVKTGTTFYEKRAQSHLRGGGGPLGGGGGRTVCDRSHPGETRRGQQRRVRQLPPAHAAVQSGL